MKNNNTQRSPILGKNALSRPRRRSDDAQGIHFRGDAMPTLAVRGYDQTIDFDLSWRRCCAFLTALLVFFALAPSVTANDDTSKAEKYDIVIYGGSPSGLSAAIQAARLGSRAIVVDPYRHIGGMMSAGLTRTDIGHPPTTGGLCIEFYARMAEHYAKLGVKRQRRFDFEPHVAAIIWNQMLAGDRVGGRVTVLGHTRLTEVVKNDAKISEIIVRDAKGVSRKIAGKIFIDATYEGDLAAMAGAPYMLGREAKADFNEPHGLEKADRLLQAYCLRLCVTDVASNRVAIKKPAGYDPKEFALLARYVNEKKITKFVLDCLLAREKTNGKADGNATWPCWVSTDWASFHHDYPEGSHERREEIYQEYKRRTLSWFYFLQNDPAVPEVLRQDALRWGLAKDEFQDTDHVPFMPYIREARRITGEYIFKEQDTQTDTIKKDSIGCGGYPIDSHQVYDYNINNLHMKIPEGNFQIGVTRGYQIPYRILVPKKVDNLLVSLCVSSTHLGYCSLRLEPEYMKMGQAAGAAATLCIKHDVTPAKVDVRELQEILRAAGAILRGPKPK